MKHLAATTDRLTGLMKKGKLHNKEVNTRTFKQKVLSNKGIAYTEESLEREYSRYNTNKNQVTKSKRYASQLRNVSKDLLELLYKKYGPSLELSEEYFESLECIERDELFYDIHGLLTKYYDRQVKISRGSKFQRILMAGLKYNMKVSTLYCRSSYEKQWIRFFEKNKIAWQYEPFTINGKNRGTYTPDFIIDLEGKKVVLEVKGTMYGYPEDYMDNKINACREYCKNKNYRFLYILNKKPNLEVLKG